MSLDTYLDIAEAVLRAARRPLTARAIIDAAHRGGIVPAHLHGKAQHKTLQARLSEDILHRKLESRFYRTDPGCFFLSELRSDPCIPDKFKDPFHARRRTRDLGKGSALAFDKSYFVPTTAVNACSWRDLLKSANLAGALKYVDSRTSDENLLFVWAFSIVRRNDQILSYRIGRYRDNRDAFANRRSIGFAEMVGSDDLSLFSDDMGVTECGLSAVLSDLDLSRSAFPTEIVHPTVSFTFVPHGDAAEPAVLFIMEWQCPDWFEPTARRLSLNEVRWIDATHRPNDIEAFEPWSVIAFEALILKAQQRRTNGQKDWVSAGCVFSI
jgi:HB1, ASXL, restriction endonuclease HTH domain